MYSAMAKIWFKWVKAHKKKIADIPTEQNGKPVEWADEVRQMLRDEGLDPEDY